jgi:hypothetical protein
MGNEGVPQGPVVSSDSDLKPENVIDGEGLDFSVASIGELYSKIDNNVYRSKSGSEYNSEDLRLRIDKVLGATNMEHAKDIVDYIPRIGNLREVVLRLLEEMRGSHNNAKPTSWLK